MLFVFMPFVKNETESKMENSTHTFQEMNLLLQLILESRIKSETELELAKEIRVQFLYHLLCPKEIFLTYVFYLNV